MWNVYRLVDDLGCYWQLVGTFKTEDQARSYQMQHKDEWLTKRKKYELDEDDNIVLRG